MSKLLCHFNELIHFLWRVWQFWEMLKILFQISLSFTEICFRRIVRLQKDKQFNEQNENSKNVEKNKVSDMTCHKKINKCQILRMTLLWGGARALRQKYFDIQK